ncbi:MAG: hypothetical protein U0930_25220 [Pirellulales bacterium]
MSDRSPMIREKLLDVQEMSSELRDLYRSKLTPMLEHQLSPRSRVGLVALLVLLILFVTVGLRSLIFFDPGPFIYSVWAIFTTICAGGALWIAASLWYGSFLWQSYWKLADGFTLGIALITVLSLRMGVNESSSVAASLCVFPLLGICIAWSLHNRIAAAELTSKEHMLRIECRLTELSKRLQNEAGNRVPLEQ